MSNIDYRNDTSISTLGANPAGNIVKSTISDMLGQVPVVETLTEETTGVIMTNSTTVTMTFDTNVDPNSQYYSYASGTGILSIIKPGTYAYNYTLLFTIASGTAIDLTSILQLNSTTTITGSTGIVDTAGAATTDRYTVNVSGTFTTTATTDNVRIRVTNGTAANANCIVGSKLQIYNINITN